MSDPIGTDEMAGILQRAVNASFGCEIAEAPHGAAFEFTAPATGQRFRAVITEAPPWSEQMDRELEEVTGKAAQS